MKLTDFLMLFVVSRLLSICIYITAYSMLSVLATNVFKQLQAIHIISMKEHVHFMKQSVT